MMTRELKIGQRIVTDDDAGIVDAIDGELVTVRWDTLIVTTQPASVLLAAMDEADESDED